MVLINPYKWMLFLWAIVLWCVDRFTKLWAAGLEQPFDLHVLSFEYVRNTGAAFSILKGYNTLFIILSIIIAYLIIHYRKELPKASLVLILAGLSGNLFDRMVYGHVIDFINFHWWPVFNLADMMIVIGVCWAILSAYVWTRARRAPSGLSR